MTDVIVSIRMPKTLFLELKKSAEEQHFLDVSEEIRSIVRSRWMQHTKPELFELKKLRESIKDEIKSRSVEKIRAEVNKELEKIKAELKKEGLSHGK